MNTSEYTFTSAKEFQNFLYANFAPVIAKMAGKLFVELQCGNLYFDREISSAIASGLMSGLTFEDIACDIRSILTLR